MLCLVRSFLPLTGISQIGHNKDFCYTKRGFSTPEEMDTAILLRCNELVRPDDELWILGDLAMSGRCDEWNRVFYNLNCQHVHFLQGNHDSENKIDLYENDYGMIYHGYADIFKFTKKKFFYLSHYPTIVSNFDDDKKAPLINLFGHTHQKTVFYSNNPYMYNVGVDAHDCYPVSIEQIIKDIKKREGELKLEK